MIDTPSLIVIIGICSGVAGLLIRYTFKSKCDQVSICFGCLKVHREVNQEETIIDDSQKNENKL
jgi:hypothetical protein